MNVNYWSIIPVEIAAQIINYITDIETLRSIGLISKRFQSLVRTYSQWLTSTKKLQMPLVRASRFKSLSMIDNISLVINQLEDISVLSLMPHLRRAVFVIRRKLIYKKDFADIVNDLIDAYQTQIVVSALDGTRHIRQRSLDEVTFRILIIPVNRIFSTVEIFEILIDHGNVILFPQWCRLFNFPPKFPIQPLAKFTLVDTIDDTIVAINNIDDIRELVSMDRLRNVHLSIGRMSNFTEFMGMVVNIIDHYLMKIIITNGENQRVVERKLHHSLLRITGKIEDIKFGLIIDHGRVYIIDDVRFEDQIENKIAEINQLVAYLNRKEKLLKFFHPLPRSPSTDIMEEIRFLVGDLLLFIEEGDFGLSDPSVPPSEINPPLKQKLQMLSTRTTRWNSIYGMLRIYLFVNGITEHIYTKYIRRENVDERSLEKYFRHTIIRYNLIHAIGQIHLNRICPFTDISRLLEFSAIRVHRPDPYDIGEIRVPEIETTEEQLDMEDEIIHSIIVIYRSCMISKKPIYRTDGSKKPIYKTNGTILV